MMWFEGVFYIDDRAGLIRCRIEDKQSRFREKGTSTKSKKGLSPRKLGSMKKILSLREEGIS